jgi:hypothetical protein
MKVCILGVGRSGTTALYTFMQKIMIDLYEDNVDFIYEPFLWDKNRFNGIYCDVIEYFREMDSISIKGLYHHQMLPLLITNPRGYSKNEYLNGIFQKNKSHLNILVKFIRANGRFLLLNKICPGCKFIYVIRNPIDVINSVIIRFSFFGSEFHKDDFKRFVKEVNSLYGEVINARDIKSRVEKEVLYWFYMNRFALEVFKKVTSKPLIICYEDYIQNRNRWVDRICDFLGIEQKKRYYGFSENPGGSNTKTINLDKYESRLLEGYLEKYKELLEMAGTGCDIDYNRLITKYSDLPHKSSEIRPIPGKTPNYLNNRLKDMARIIQQKDKEIRTLKQKLKQMEMKKGLDSQKEAI